MSKIFYFTFGRTHVNSVGISLMNCYCPIRAKDESAARQKMMEARGVQWAFIYPSKKEAGIKRFNLIEVPLIGVHLDEYE